MEKITYTIPECARILGVSVGVCYEAARSGQIPIIRLGKRRMVVPRFALLKMLEGTGIQIDPCQYK